MTTATADMPRTHARSTPASNAHELSDRPRRVAQVLGWLASAMGVVVVVGWWLDIDALTSLVPGAPPMVANSALMSLLAGASVHLLAPVERGRPRTVAGKLCAAATLGIGVVTLLEYLVPIEASGFDLMLASPQEHPALVRYPGRPSPHTAVAFGCVGLALLLLERPAGRLRLRPAEVLLVAGLALPGAAMLGYIFDVEALYGVPGLVPYTGMAINTAFVLLLLCGAGLLARPDQGMMAVITSDAPGGVAARRMLLGVVSLLALGLLLVGGIEIDLYNASIGASLVVLSSFGATTAFILTTAMHLNRADAEARAGRVVRARLASLVESSDDGIYITTPDGVVVHWNPACEAIYGYRADEMVGRSIFDLVPEHEVDAYKGRLATIQRGGRVKNYETMRQRRDGSLVPLSLSLSPVGGTDGTEPMGISTIARDISDRKAAEQALRTSEARFRSLFELAADGIFVADRAGHYTDVNEAGCKLLGCRRDQLVGRPITDLLPASDVDRLRASRRQMLGGEKHVAEWTLVGCDRREIPVEVSATILPDERWLGFVRNISQRRAAERALAEAHTREQELRHELERVLAASARVAEAIATLSESGLQRVLTAIATQAQMLTHAEYAAVGIGANPDAPFELWASVGVDEETVRRIGRPPRAVGTLAIPPRTGETMHVADVREHPAFQGFPPHHPEMTSLLAVPIRYGSAPVGNLYLANKRDAPEFTDADERIVTLLGERLGAAIETARLYDSEALQRIWLQAIIDHMPEGLIILDEDGRVLQQNPAAGALATECAGDEASSSALCHAFCTPEGAPLTDEEQPGRRALRGDPVVGQEHTLRDANGRLVTVLVSASPVRTRRGSAGAVIVFQNISALKELERLREEWASVVAHDLRQPVAAIDLGAQALLHMPEDALGADARTVLERIRGASRRLARMIDDLLDASRIEAQRLSLVRAEVDLSQLIRECLQDQREALAGHPIELDLEPDVLVELDPDRMRQVMCNLVSNAAKYGTEGTPVQLTLRDDDSTVELAVTNHGPGIEPDELPRLFERFERTRGGKASGKAGLGLGLYITRALVEAHGGHIRAESTPGETTTFYVTLPRQGSGPATTPDPRSPEP